MTIARPHLRRRRLIGSALAAAVLFAGAMSACSPSPSQLPQVETTALTRLTGQGAHRRRLPPALTATPYPSARTSSTSLPRS